MPQNALLHFPLVDLVCLRQTVCEHTQRVVNLIHEYNDYLTKCKFLSASKRLTPIPFPFFFNEPQSKGSWKGNGVFSVAGGRQSKKNDSVVSRNIGYEQSDSVINRVKSSELNNLHQEVTSGSEWRVKSEENIGNLTSLSCPECFSPSEKKPNFFRVPGFETFVASPKGLSNAKQSEFVCGSGNKVRGLKSFPSPVIENVKMEHNNTKMDLFNNFEEDDEVVVIEVKKEKNIEVITIDEDEEEEKGNNCMPPLENIAIHVPVISKITKIVDDGQKPKKTVDDVNPTNTFDDVKVTKTVDDVNPTIPRDNWEVPPYLTPEFSQPPCLSPEIMEPIYNTELSQPPLIFPEIDPPMWTYSVPSPMIYSEDAQPPILTPEVRDLVLTPDTSLLLSHPPMMSDALPPKSNTPDPLSLDMPASTLVRQEPSTSEFVMTSHQDSTSFKTYSKLSIPSENSTNHITSVQQSEFSFGYLDGIDLDDPFTITPKKTNDITKIKGWKTKQFFVEKCEPVQSCSSFGKTGTKIENENSIEQKEDMEIDDTENAFVSQKLDKFLDGEVDLKINYEIPHLYAELGITLTKDAVMSRPNVSQEEMQMFEEKYRVYIDVNSNDGEEFLMNKKIKRSKQKGKKRVKKAVKQGKKVTKKAVIPWNKGKKLTKKAMVPEQKEEKDIKKAVLPEEKEKKGIKKAVIPEEKEKKGIKKAVLPEEKEKKGIKKAVLPEEKEKKGIKKAVIPEEKEKKGIKKAVIPEQKENRGIKRKLKQGCCPKNTKKLVVRKETCLAVKGGKVETGRTLNHSPGSKQIGVTSQGIASCSFEMRDFNGKALEGHGSTKVFGLALYPGPYAPLPKLVQHCLDDFRSRKNKIDRNWANFALSALVVPQRCQYERKILPIQCAVETSGMKESTPRQSAKEVNDLPPQTQTEVNDLPPQTQTEVNDLPPQTQTEVNDLPPQTQTEVNDLPPQTQTEVYDLPPQAHTEVNKVVTKLVHTVSTKSSKKPTAVPALEKLIIKPKRLVTFKEPEKNCRKRKWTDDKTNKKGSEVKECQILVEKVKKPSRVWCMDHHHYNCNACGFGQETEAGENDDDSTEESQDSSELFMLSSTFISDQDMTSLLTEKLRYTPWKDIIVNNIDTLKIIVPGALEFVKLNIVRENFLNKCIYLWYLKPNSNLRNKSRAFLSFSENLPLPYAIRIKSDADVLEENVPIVLKDIIMMKKENTDIEYVILHCNGKVWQISGSLRYATDKSSPDNSEKDSLKVEEVFTPTYPRELEVISEAAAKVIKDPTVKWWVLDLNQNFTSIVSELDSKIRTITKKGILYGLKTKFYGFLALNKSSTRVIWVHLFPKILPYVLIGPYKLSEPHGLVLRQGSNVIPFSYHTHLFESPNVSLKSFINSVVVQVQEQERELSGLWLCDRQQVDRTCYLEVISKSPKENIFSIADYDVDVEHDYSLMSRINRDKRRTTQNIDVRKVYLYFDLADLGYIAGDLHGDDTVVTINPLDQKTVYIPLNKFAKWFLGLITERISILPNTRNLKCFITRNVKDLRQRKPFNANYLGGSYMICEVGPFSQLKLINVRNIEWNSDLLPNESSQVGSLQYVLYRRVKGSFGKCSVLTQAETDIRKLDTLTSNDYSVYKVLITVELGARYIHMLECLDCDEAEKISLFEWIKDLFDKNQQSLIDKYCKEVLQLYQFGRLYLILKEARDTMEAESKAAAEAAEAAKARAEAVARRAAEARAAAKAKAAEKKPPQKMRKKQPIQTNIPDIIKLPRTVNKVMLRSGEWREQFSVAKQTAEEFRSKSKAISILKPLNKTSTITSVETLKNSSVGTITDSPMKTSVISSVHPLMESPVKTPMETSRNIVLVPSTSFAINDNTGNTIGYSASMGFTKTETVGHVKTASSTLSMDPGHLGMVNFTNPISMENAVQNMETPFCPPLSNYVNTFNRRDFSVIMVQGLLCDLSAGQRPVNSVVGDLSQKYEAVTSVEPESIEMETLPQYSIPAPNEERWSVISEPVYTEMTTDPTEINVTSHEEQADDNSSAVFVPPLSVNFDLVDELYTHPVLSKLLL